MPHSWRRQFSLIDRRHTASQLVDFILANGLSPEAAAAEFDVPLETVREALDYCERQGDLVAAEAAEERRRTEPFLPSPTTSTALTVRGFCCKKNSITTGFMPR